MRPAGAIPCLFMLGACASEPAAPPVSPSSPAPPTVSLAIPPPTSAPAAEAPTVAPLSPPPSNGTLTAPSPASPPTGWWSVRDPDGKPNGQAVQMNATELLFATKKGDVAFRPARLVLGDSRIFVWEVSGARCVYTPDATAPGGTLRCQDGPRRDVFALVPSTDGPRLDALAAKSRPRRDACERAEPCLVALYAATGARSKPDFDAEFGNPRMPQRCEAVLSVAKSLFDAKHQVTPDICK